MDLVRIIEGETKLFVPDLKKYKLDSNMPVFFNPIMKLNRDITVEIIKSTLKKPKVLHLHRYLPLGGGGSCAKTHQCSLWFSRLTVVGK